MPYLLLIFCSFVGLESPVSAGYLSLTRKAAAPNIDFEINI